jgi:hypothetical protein
MHVLTYLCGMIKVTCCCLYSSASFSYLTALPHQGHACSKLHGYSSMTRPSTLIYKHIAWFILKSPFCFISCPLLTTNLLSINIIFIIAIVIHYRKDGLCRAPNALPGAFYLAHGKGHSLGHKQFVLAAKTGFCWRARNPPATLSQ